MTFPSVSYGTHKYIIVKLVFLYKKQDSMICNFEFLVLGTNFIFTFLYTLDVDNMIVNFLIVESFMTIPSVS